MLKNILRTFRIIYFLHRSSWSASVKRRLLFGYIKQIPFSTSNRSVKQAKILGCTLRFGDYTDFAYLFSEIFARQIYSFNTTSAEPRIIDCGSNIGMSVLFFKLAYPHSHIIAFEPSDEAFSYLERNIASNRLDHVHAHRTALCAETGTIDFYYDQSNATSLRMSTKKERMPKATRKVTAERLSQYVHGRVDFLKIDIEGSELDVIKDLHRNDKLRLVSQMAIEYHHNLNDDAGTLSTLLLLLEDAGFGYQMESPLCLERPFKGSQSQDVLVYAYRKDTIL